MKIIIAVLIFLTSFQINAQSREVFQQKNNVKITVMLAADYESLEIKTSKNKKIQLIEDIGISVSEKESSLDIDDYNFDGFKDVGIYHVDDGMGVYYTWQLFIYNPITNQFSVLELPQNARPNCGEFCDVIVNKKRKTISSSCRGGARWHTDTWKFNKKGELYLTK
jgi:hypothetical protein